MSFTRAADLEVTNSHDETALNIGRKDSPGAADLIKAKSTPPSEEESELNREVYGSCPRCQRALEPRKRHIEVVRDAPGGLR